MDSMNEVKVKVTVEYTISNAINRDELESEWGGDLKKFMKWLLKNEGLIGIADDLNGKVIKVEETL